MLINLIFYICNNDVVIDIVINSIDNIMNFEQQLIDFFLVNKKYNNEFMLDLINLLKCNLGNQVKCSNGPNDVPQQYGVLTDNFYIFVYYYDESDYYFYAVYKFLGFTTDLNIYRIDSYVIEIHDIDHEKLKLCFERNDLILFEKSLPGSYENKLTHNEDIEYIFATTTTKSARKL